MKVVIIGAIAGGATVASQIRRFLPEAHITLIGDEPAIGYGTCGIPYVIGQEIENERLIQGPSPQKFAEQRQIDLRTETEAFQVDTKQKIVHVRCKREQIVQEIAYDALILATGTTATQPALPPHNLPVVTMKNLADMKEIQHLLSTNPQHCAIIGGGFISLEAAENFRKLGIQVTIIERNSRVMKMMDEIITQSLQQTLQENGIQLYFNEEITAIEGNKLFFKKEPPITVDFILAATGGQPNTQLAKQAHLSIGVTKGIVVNEYMQTSDPAIYAIGDVAETTDWLTNQPKRVQLAWYAHRQAFLVAKHLAQEPIAHKGFLSSMIVRVFNQTAAMTGLSAQQLKKEKRTVQTVQYTGKSNASYYPDHGDLTVLAHYDVHSRKILGAQAVGTKGVDKRIDVLTTAILGGMTIDDLALIECAYSPPYSSPKDPINWLGYKA